MKTVYFIRHAKSSWSDSSLSDFDRPLNARGFRDAEFMSKVLEGKGVRADQLISSTANRAYTTATYFADTVGHGVEAIRKEEKIYEAFAETVLQIIAELDDELETVILFGHNPTFTSLSNWYSDDYIPNVPTCGIVKVEADVEHWRDFDKERAKRTAFYYPKQFFT